MGRKEAASFLQSTLKSLVPGHVIDRVWDRVVAPLYDVRTCPDNQDKVSGQPDNSVRTALDTSGHSVRCGECFPGHAPCASCQQRAQGQP